jgi:hypothetical protein
VEYKARHAEQAEQAESLPLNQVLAFMQKIA